MSDRTNGGGLEKPSPGQTPVATKSVSGTWYRTKMFSPEKVRKLTETPLSVKLRLILKFKRRFYASEENMMIAYKDYGGVRYILSIKEQS